MERGVLAKVNRFFGRYPLKRVGADEVLVRAGEDPPGIFYLISGQVKEYDISRQGNEVVVNVFRPPAFFPMNWALNKTTNQYFFETTKPTAFRLAPADKVVSFLKRHPDVVLDLLSRVYIGTDGLLRRMAHLMGGSARSRVLFEIMVSAKRYGEPRHDGAIDVDLHEEEIANRAGLSRETVSRVLGRVKKLKLIEVNRGGIRVYDLAKLETELGANL